MDIKRLALLLSLCCVFLETLKAQELPSFVEQLPGYPKELMKSKWYSGYYDITANKALHYLFIESLNEPSTDPIVVFFNGGPGGASINLAYYGMGPVALSKFENGTINFIQFNSSWANNASLLFIDNPVNIGFSYSKRSPYDQIHNDISFTEDILTFIVKFYHERHTLRANPLYIGGVSYGGIYAPRMAWAIHNHNQELKLKPLHHKINLKGFIIANDGPDYDNNPNINTMEMLANYNIIPMTLF
jgi:carboxypeptidase C (cathepsin A)